MLKMGYTHYWYTNFEADTDVLKAKYAKLLPIVRLIVESALSCDMALEITVSEECIRINGIGCHGCEDFLWMPGKVERRWLPMEGYKGEESELEGNNDERDDTRVPFTVHRIDHATGALVEQDVVYDEEEEEEPQFPKGLFSCCKTARQDYDMIVVAVLCAIKHIYGAELVHVSSDGDDEDWSEGRALFEVFTDEA